MSEKHLTLLHSNDLHGDFHPHPDGTGGLPRLSGYVKKVRSEEKNVIYASAGDMFRGSIIDSEYLGPAPAFSSLLCTETKVWVVLEQPATPTGCKCPSGL